MSTIQISTTPNKGLNIGLWVAQGILAAMFLMGGTMKLITPIEEMAANASWINQMPWLMRFIGVSEVAGAVGLILPSLLRIKPVLTPIAAIGLVVIMILAAGYHGMRGEYSGIATCLIVGGIAAFIAWGRFTKAPIQGK